MMRVPSSGGPPPRQSDLDALFERAGSARILACGVTNGAAMGGPLLATIEHDELPKLRDALAIREDAIGFRCMCHGDLAIELLGTEKRLLRGPAPIGAIGLHHGVSARLDAWGSDAELVDGRAIFVVLANHGAPDLLAQFDAAKVAEEAARARDRAWRARAPEEIADRIAALEAMFPPRELVEEARRVVVEKRGVDAAIAKLLAWYGAGEGPWSGHPAREQIPEAILDSIGAEIVIDAIAHGRVPSDVGAARFVAMHARNRAERRTIARIPDDVRAALRTSADATEDRDNVGRLRWAFAPLQEPVAVAGRLVGLADHGNATGARLHRGVPYAIDGHAIVRFDADLAPRTLASIAPNIWAAIAFAGDRFLVFEMSKGDRSIDRVTLDGKERATIAKIDHETKFLQANATHVYWLADHSRYDGSGFRAYAVMRAPVLGGPPEIVIPQTVGGVGAFVLEDAHVVWAREHDGRVLFERWPIASAKEPVTTAATKLEGCILASDPPLAETNAHFWFCEWNGHRVGRVARDLRGAPETKRLPGQPLRIASAREGAYVWIRTGDDSCAIVHVDAEMRIETLAKFADPRAPPHVTSDDRAVLFAWEDQLLRLDGAR